MFLQQAGTQVLFKRVGGETPPEPAWVATCHNENMVDLWTLTGALIKSVSYGGGVGQWRMVPSAGHWVPESEEVFGYELTETPSDSDVPTTAFSANGLE